MDIPHFFQSLLMGIGGVQTVIAILHCICGANAYQRNLYQHFLTGIMVYFALLFVLLMLVFMGLPEWFLYLYMWAVGYGLVGFHGWIMVQVLRRKGELVFTREVGE